MGLTTVSKLMRDVQFFQLRVLDTGNCLTFSIFCSMYSIFEFQYGIIRKGCIINIIFMFYCFTIKCQYFYMASLYVAPNILLNSTSNKATRGEKIIQGIYNIYIVIGVCHVLPKVQAHIKAVYMLQDGKCIKTITPVVQLKNYVNVTSGDLQALKFAIAHQGPVSVAIDASHLSLSFYANGVYYEPQCGLLFYNLTSQLVRAIVFYNHILLLRETFYSFQRRDYVRYNACCLLVCKESKHYHLTNTERLNLVQHTLI